MKNITIIFTVLVAFAASQTTLAATFQIVNPMRWNSVIDLMVAVANFITTLGMILLPTAIVWIGFRFVTANSTGNQGDLGKVKNAFWWVIIGGAVMIAAGPLVNIAVRLARDLF